MLSSGFSVKFQTTPISSSLEVGRFSAPGAVKGVQGQPSVHCCSCDSYSLASAVSHSYTQATESNSHKDFLGCAVTVAKQRLCFQNCDQRLCWAPRAVLLAPVESSQDHVLDGNLQLKVKAMPATPSSPAKIEFQINNCYLNAPVLHWGLTKPGARYWSLPANCPEGTRVFENQALQTCFRKTGDIAFLTIDIHDTQFDAIEFILKDDSSNQWFKLHGGNFCFVLPEPDLSLAKVSIPEELVQVQSYLRWERKDKQIYSPDQQEIEYEEARKELQEGILSGVSLETLSSRLLVGEAKEEKSDASPNGGVDGTKKAKRVGKGKVGKFIQRKKRDPLELLAFGSECQTDNTAPVAAREPTALELAAKSTEGQKTFFKIGENSLLVDSILDAIKWDDKGLIVAIAQHANTGSILMQGFANRDAVSTTIASGKATFYSRSRSSLWTKGETSSNFINVIDLFLDCDRDSIIYLGEPDGPTCHTGAETCYFTPACDIGNGTQTTSKKYASTTLYSLEETIGKRKEGLSLPSMLTSSKPSWTQKLLKDNNLLCSKIREEADELCRTLENNEGKNRTASEMADVLYHAMVLLAVQDVKLVDVLKILQARFPQSGIEEKSSRK